MERLRVKIDKIFKGAGKSFYRFPGAIVSAVVISIVAIVRIALEWEVQKRYNLLFDSIQISFALSAVLSMAGVALYEIKQNEKKSFFILANILGAVVASISFLLLYFYGGGIPENETVYLSNIALARISVAIFVSGVMFVYIISKSKGLNSFSDSFFITHKAFSISAIYGLVIMLGVSGVLGAFNALVYTNMDYKVYQYLGVAVGFFTYMIFLGYFPSFKKSENDIEIKEIKEHPRFIVVLFDYILIPIMTALTTVLLIWSLKVIVEGVDVSFNRLSGIASSYVMIGIWLHMMVANHKTKIAEFYKKMYPITGMLILAFEAWALFVQLSKFGLKTAEYSFLMIWIFGLISVLLLFFLKDRAYRKIAMTGVVVSIIWILPIVGYQDITFNSQVKRLEQILIREEILIDGHIIMKDKEIEYITRGEITDAVDFISYSEKLNTPNWFKEDLDDWEVFKETFGFEKTYGLYLDDSENYSINYRLESNVIDVSDYSLSLNLNEHVDNFIEFENEGKTYQIEVLNKFEGVPAFKVKLEDRLIIEEDMAHYLTDLINQYPVEENREIKLPFEEMNMVLETEGLSVLIVFNSIDTYFDKVKNKSDYYVDFSGIYIGYK